MGVWSLGEKPSSVGGLYSRRYREWLAAEVSVDMRRGSPVAPGLALAIADARFMVRNRYTSRDYFVTVGVAAGHGLSYRASPVVGAGFRWHIEDVVALRLELQRFTRAGRLSADSGRLLLSVGVGIR